MKRLKTILLLLFVLGTLGPVGAAAAIEEGKGNAQIWERSVVTLEATHKVYDYMRPWSKGARNTVKSGVVIGPKEVLVTADELGDLIGQTLTAKSLSRLRGGPIFDELSSCRGPYRAMKRP